MMPDGRVGREDAADPRHGRTAAGWNGGKAGGTRCSGASPGGFRQRCLWRKKGQAGVTPSEWHRDSPFASLGNSRMDSAKEFCPHSMFERANAIVAHSVKQAITTMLIPQITLAHLCSRTGKLDLRPQ